MTKEIKDLRKRVDRLLSNQQTPPDTAIDILFAFDRAVELSRSKAEDDTCQTIMATIESMANGLQGVQRCRVCGCTDDDCSGCIDRTGHRCHWIEKDLCSACSGYAPAGSTGPLLQTEDKHHD